MKDKTIQIRCSEEERLAIKAAAVAARFGSVSQFVIYRLLSDVPIAEVPEKEVTEFY